MGEYVKKDRKGTMWKENNCKVVWKGSMHHKENPEDPNDRGQDKYYSILKTVMKDKYGNEKSKFELVQSVGLLYLKDDNFNTNGNPPAIGGPVTVDLGSGQTVGQKFGGWLQTNEEKGTQYLSVGLVDSNRNKEATSEDEIFPPSQDFDDDQVPF